VASYCTSCAAVLEPGVKFCPACGAHVEALSIPAAGVGLMAPHTVAVANGRDDGRRLMVVRRIAPMSAAKIEGTLMALMGLLIGLMFTAIGSVASSLAPQASSSGLGFMGAAFGVGAIIILPICYGVFGFIAGLIGAGLYNVLAGIVGGIEIETSER
jgi:hypothetical protein